MSTIDYAEILRLAKAGRRAEKRSKAIGGCIGGLILNAVACLARGFWLMLAVGIAHHEWLPTLPTLGYWWAVLLVSLLAGTFSIFPEAKESAS